MEKVKKIISMILPVIISGVVGLLIDPNIRVKAIIFSFVLALMLPLYCLNKDDTNGKILDRITSVLTWVFIVGMLSIPIILFI